MSNAEFVRYQTKALAALAVAKQAVHDAWLMSDDADVDFTLEAVMGEIDGLAEYVTDPSHHAYESLGFTG